MLDLALHLMNHPEPVSVTAVAPQKLAKRTDIRGWWGEWDRKAITVEDFAAGFIRFKNGAALTLECSWLANMKEPELQKITLMGTEAGAEWPELTIHGEKAGSTTDLQLKYADDGVGGHHREIAFYADAILTGKSSPGAARAEPERHPHPRWPVSQPQGRPRSKGLTVAVLNRVTEGTCFRPQRKRVPFVRDSGSACLFLGANFQRRPPLSSFGTQRGILAAEFIGPLALQREPLRTAASFHCLARASAWVSFRGKRPEFAVQFLAARRLQNQRCGSAEVRPAGRCNCTGSCRPGCRRSSRGRWTCLNWPAD